MHYGLIPIFYEEWNKQLKERHNKIELPSPVNFWMKCVDRQIRGYFFIEHLQERLHHYKEANMPAAGVFKRVKLFIDGKRIQFKTWYGGGDFVHDIDESKIVGNFEDHVVDVSMEGFRHYTRFPLSKCIKTLTYEEFITHKQNQILNYHQQHNLQHNGVFDLNLQSKSQYIMHIHLRDHSNHTMFNKRVVYGIAKHLEYHRCVMSLTGYEVAVHEENIPLFMENPYIAQAARNGWLTFLVRNKYNPSPIHIRKCYYIVYDVIV